MKKYHFYQIKHFFTQRKTIYTGWSILLIASGIMARLLPHPANFTPLNSTALFAGKELPKKTSLFIPLIIMTISDAIIGWYSWKIMLAVYLSFSITVYLGRQLTNQNNFTRLASFTLLSSIIFFIITNAAVWMFSPLYPHTFNGLLLAYWYGLPFFRNELMGNIFYVIIIFGLAEISKIIIFQKESYANTKA